MNAPRVPWTEEEIRKAIIPLPANVRERFEVARFLRLNAPHMQRAGKVTVAMADFSMPKNPFAVVFFLERKYVTEKGWPIFICEKTRVWVVEGRSSCPTP